MCRDGQKKIDKSGRKREREIEGKKRERTKNIKGVERKQRDKKDEEK